MGAGHFGYIGFPNVQGASEHIGGRQTYGGIWTPPKSPHTSKENSRENLASTAVRSFSFLKWSGRGSKGDTG